MSDSHPTLQILAYAFSVAAVIAAAYSLVESLLRVSLFSVFWKAIPHFLQSFFPNMPFTTWLLIRAQRNVHQAWDVALFLLFILSVTLSFMTGFFVFFILNIFGIHTIGMYWLILWFASLFILYFISAGNQVAIGIKFQHPRATRQRIIQYMQQDQTGTIKKFFAFFFRNWLISPWTGFKLLLILFLLILLDGPGWLIRLLPQGSKLDLTDDNIRKYYYIAYTAFFGVNGLTLMFLFRD